MFTLATQPQSFGEVVNAGFMLFKDSFTKVVPIALLLSLWRHLSYLFIPEEMKIMLKPDLTPEALFALLLAGLKEHFLSYLLFNLFYLACVVAISGIIIHCLGEIMHGRKPDNTVAFLAILQKFPALFIASVFFIIIFTLGFASLIIPGVIFFISLFFFFPLMVLDDEGIGKAYARSSRLVQGNWLRTANMLMFMLLAYIAALLIFGNVFALLSGADESAFQEGNFIVEMTYVVTSTVTTPLFFSIMLVQFHDLKLRKEGRSSQKKTPPSQKDFIA